LSRSGVKLEASGLFELHVYPLPAEFAKEKYSFVCSILAATAVANESAPWPKFRSLDDFPLIFSYRWEDDCAHRCQSPELRSPRPSPGLPGMTIEWVSNLRDRSDRI